MGGEPKRDAEPAQDRTKTKVDLMLQDENLAGYDLLSPGADDLAGRTIPVASVSIPEIKSLFRLAAGVVVIAALYFGKDVLIPITLAVMLSFLLAPIVSLLQRLRFGRAPAVILTVLAALGIFGLVATLFATQATSLAADAPRYAKSIESKFEGLSAFTAARLASVTREFTRAKPARQQAQASTASSTMLSDKAPISAAGDRTAVIVEVASPEMTPLAVAKAVFQPVLRPLETFVIVLIVAIFILFQREDLRDRFIRLFGSSDLHRTTLAMDDAVFRLSRYFLSQLAVNASFGIVIAVGLWAIGIPSAAMWGMLAGILRFIPYIGAFLAVLPPLVLAAAIDPGWSTVVYVVLFFVIVEVAVGYVIEPLLYGHSTGLSPVSVIVAAVFWTWIWGPIGLIISTPLTLCFVVLGRHVKSLEFFDVLLGDRPALSATESFYQRILADNPDEALAHAESLLTDSQLIDYYDGVVVEGLALATEDEKRGIIDRSRSRQMLRAVLSVIADLGYRGNGDTGETANVAEPQSTEFGTVACIAGRGPFDTAISAMLLQLMEQNNVERRAISHDAVSRDRIGELDLSGVSVILLAYAELSQSPAHLRFLVKRLRQRAPHAKIVVGLWAKDEAALTDASIQQAIGADRYVGSLNEALEQALALLTTDCTIAAPAHII